MFRNKNRPHVFLPFFVNDAKTFLDFRNRGIALERIPRYESGRCAINGKQSNIHSLSDGWCKERLRVDPQNLRLLYSFELSHPIGGQNYVQKTEMVGKPLGIGWLACRQGIWSTSSRRTRSNAATRTSSGTRWFSLYVQKRANPSIELKTKEETMSPRKWRWSASEHRLEQIHKNR